MPTKAKTTYHSLNMSPLYAPGWGVWEVAREIICNAMDATGTDFELIAEGEDQLSVHTNTNPVLAELFVIGQGSKHAGGETIGQFGEGLKLSALVATRDGQGMSLRLKGYRVEFLFKKVMGSDVLHAQVTEEPDDTFEGFTVTVNMKGIKSAYDGRFIDATDGPKPKHSQDILRVYCKGVYICEKPTKSLWDWNLNRLGINRDRAVVSAFDQDWELNRWLQENATKEQLVQILRASNTWEHSVAGAYTVVSDSLFGERMSAAFREVYGEQAVLATDSTKDTEIAVKMGHSIVNMATNIKNVLDGHIPNASQVARPKQPTELIAIDVAPFQAKIDILKKLNAVVGIEDVKVCVFKNFSESIQGRGDVDNTILWLKESLFEGDYDSEEWHILVGTYLHELAFFSPLLSDTAVRLNDVINGMVGSLACNLIDWMNPTSGT